MKNGDQPIKPLATGSSYHCTGLTKREYFASLALQSIMAKKFDDPNEYKRETVADAIEYADELLKQLER
jgi:hypothetical protein